jgi:hypothetical protein
VLRSESGPYPVSIPTASLILFMKSVNKHLFPQYHSEALTAVTMNCKVAIGCKAQQFVRRPDLSEEYITSNFKIEKQAKSKKLADGDEKRTKLQGFTIQKTVLFFINKSCIIFHNFRTGIFHLHLHHFFIFLF